MTDSPEYQAMLRGVLECPFNDSPLHAAQPSPPSTHRVKCGPKFAGQSSRFDGRIVGERNHDTNGLPMVLLAFPNAAHQQFWGGTWLYLDDLEMI